MFFVEFFKALERAQVRYLLVGGVALHVHGVPRSTADIDLFVDLEPENVRRFLDAIESFGYRPAVPVAAADLADEEARSRWRTEKNMVVLGFRSDTQRTVPVDVFVAEPFPFGEAYRRRKSSPIEGTGVRISTIGLDDFIAMKEAAGRAQDLDDADALRRVRKVQEKET